MRSQYSEPRSRNLQSQCGEVITAGFLLGCLALTIAIALCASL